MNFPSSTSPVRQAAKTCIPRAKHRSARSKPKPESQPVTKIALVASLWTGIRSNKFRSKRKSKTIVATAHRVKSIIKLMEWMIIDFSQK